MYNFREDKLLTDTSIKETDEEGPLSHDMLYMEDVTEESE